MSIKSYKNTVSYEPTAEKYVLRDCFKNQQRYYSFCRAREFVRLCDERHCSKWCKKVFYYLMYRWRNELKLSLDDWLYDVKFFNLELSVGKISKQFELPYKTVFKTMIVIRHAILVHATDDIKIIQSGAFELDESYIGGRRKGNRDKDVGGEDSCLWNSAPRRQDACRRRPKCTCQNVSRDYCEKRAMRQWIHIAYVPHICRYKHLFVDHFLQFGYGKIHIINGLEGFWIWANEHLFKHHGISPRWLPSVFKEVEFRYNCHEENIFDDLARYISDIIAVFPEPDLKKYLYLNIVIKASKTTNYIANISIQYHKSIIKFIF